MVVDINIGGEVAENEEGSRRTKRKIVEDDESKDRDIERSCDSQCDGHCSHYSRWHHQFSDQV